MKKNSICLILTAAMLLENGAVINADELKNTVAIQINEESSDVEDIALPLDALETYAVVNEDDTQYAVEGGNLYFNQYSGQITCCDTTVTSAIIPESINGMPVTGIGENAFADCTFLTSLVIPNTVTVIDVNAFSNCTQLSELTLSEALTTINDSAFNNCTSLTGIQLGAFIESVATTAFNGCSSLVDISVNTDNQVYSSLDGVLFTDASTTLVKYPEGKKQSQYVIPDGVVELGDWSFSNCALLANLTIPETVTIFGGSLFENTALQSVECVSGSAADNATLYPNGTIIYYSDETTTETTTESSTEITTVDTTDTPITETTSTTDTTNPPVTESSSVSTQTTDESTTETTTTVTTETTTETTTTVTTDAITETTTSVTTDTTTETTTESVNLFIQPVSPDAVIDKGINVIDYDSYVDKTFTVNIDFSNIENTAGLNNYSFFLKYDPSVVMLTGVNAPDQLDNFITYSDASGESLLYNNNNVLSAINYIPSVTDPDYTDVAADGTLTSAQLGKVKFSNYIDETDANGNLLTAAKSGTLISLSFKIISSGDTQIAIDSAYAAGIDGTQNLNCITFDSNISVGEARETTTVTEIITETTTTPAGNIETTTEAATEHTTNEVNELILHTDSNNITVNGRQFNIINRPYKNNDGYTMVPVSELLDIFGYRYSEETVDGVRTLTCYQLDGGKILITEGSDILSYMDSSNSSGADITALASDLYITEDVNMSCAAELKNGTLFIAYNDFAPIVGLEASVAENNIVYANEPYVMVDGSLYPVSQMPSVSQSVGSNSSGGGSSSKATDIRRIDPDSDELQSDNSSRQITIDDIEFTDGNYIYNNVDYKPSIDPSLLDDVNDELSAVEAVQKAASQMSEDEKNTAIGADYLTIFAEAAISKATELSVDNSDVLVIDDVLVDEAVSSVESTTKAVNQVLEDNISVQRKLVDTVVIRSGSSSKLTIDKKSLSSNVNRVKVSLPYAAVSYDANDVSTLTVEPVSTNKIKVEFGQQTTNTKVQVNFAQLDGDDKYMAILDEDGQAIGGHYNPMTGEISAKLNESGIYTLANNEKDFNDIKDLNAEMQSAIKLLASKGIISGTAEREFSPEDDITRAEIAALIVRMLGVDDPNADGGFVDVDNTDWYFGTAGSSKRENIIVGYDDNTFRGTQVIPKLQILAVSSRVLKNYMNYNDVADADTVNAVYTDNTIADWAKDDIALATEANIVVKRVDGAFDGESEITRGEAALMIARLYDKLWY